MRRSFFDLIDRMNELPSADRAAMEEEVWRDFGVRKAVMALDMSHFSLSVRRTGIVAYLGQIRRMRLTTGPIVERCGGEVVKYEADNMMAVFPDVSHAVAAALEINRGIAEAGGTSVGIGIDFGDFLQIPEHDCFGDPVNIAYKLGEDLAQAGEILLTSVARERLGAECAWRMDERRHSVSGLDLHAFCVMA